MIQAERSWTRDIIAVELVAIDPLETAFRETQMYVWRDANVRFGCVCGRIPLAIGAPVERVCVRFLGG